MSVLRGVVVALVLPSVLLACAKPMGPTIAIGPGDSKTAEQFAADQQQCGLLTASVIKPQLDKAGEDALARLATSAASGTAGGAGLGALLGHGKGRNVGYGAAAGAGAGALVGVTRAGNSYGEAEARLQLAYDSIFSDCMTKRGNVPLPVASGASANPGGAGAMPTGVEQRPNWPLGYAMAQNGAVARVPQLNELSPGYRAAAEGARATPSIANETTPRLAAASSLSDDVRGRSLNDPDSIAAKNHFLAENRDLLRGCGKPPNIKIFPAPINPSNTARLIILDSNPACIGGGAVGENDYILIKQKNGQWKQIFDALNNVVYVQPHSIHNGYADLLVAGIGDCRGTHRWNGSQYVLHTRTGWCAKI
jgi:hypothetical protein